MAIVSGIGNVNQVASVSGAYDGPWAIETQSLRIEYARTPNSMIFSSKTGAALSGVTTRSYAIGSTALSVQVYWTCRKIRQYGSYATSSEETKQRFSISPDATDLDNNTPLGTLSAGILGKAGVIDTSTAYYSRKPWTSTDTEYTYTGLGYNFICPVYRWGQLSDGTYGTIVYRGEYDAYVLNRRDRGIDKLAADTFKGVNEMTAPPSWIQENVDKIYVWDPLYEIQGPFALDKESPTYVPTLLDIIGEKIKFNQVINSSYPSNDVTGDTVSIQIGSSCYGGTPYYDIYRHNYT